MNFVELPLKVVEELQQSMRNAVEDAFSHYGVWSDEDHAAAIRAARKFCVDTLANFTPRPRTSSWSHLPAETMRRLALLLEQDELNNIAQVCQSWRNLVLRDKLLWTHFELSSSVPGPECCCGSRSDYYQIGSSRKEYLRDELALMRLFVDRSDGQPLVIRLDIEHQTPHPLVFTELISIINSVANRIDTLNLRFQTSDAFNAFTYLLPELPSLRVLSVDLYAQISDLKFPASLLLHILYLPGSSMQWNAPAAGLSNVEELVMSISNASDCRHISATFPRLKTIHLDCTHGWRDATDDDWDAAAAFIEGLQDVILEYSMQSGWNTADILRVVERAANIPRISLDCYPYTYTGFQPSDAIAPYALLDHLAGPVRLQWTTVGNTIEVTGTDAQGRTRSLAIAVDESFIPSLKDKAHEVVGNRLLEELSAAQ